MKQDSAQKAESERASSSKSRSRIFGEDEKEKEARDLTAKATERLARLEMATRVSSNDGIVRKRKIEALGWQKTSGHLLCIW